MVFSLKLLMEMLPRYYWNECYMLDTTDKKRDHPFERDGRAGSCYAFIGDD